MCRQESQDRHDRADATWNNDLAALHRPNRKGMPAVRSGWRKGISI